MQGTANGEAWKMKDEVSYESRKKGRPGRSIGLVGNCKGLQDACQSRPGGCLQGILVPCARLGNILCHRDTPYKNQPAAITP
jgi:hypothetical protein